MAVTYHSLSDKELEGYSDFLKSKVGQGAYDKAFIAYDNILARLMRTFGERMMVLFGHKKA